MRRVGACVSALYKRSALDAMRDSAIQMFRVDFLRSINWGMQVWTHSLKL